MKKKVLFIILLALIGSILLGLSSCSKKVIQPIYTYDSVRTVVTERLVPVEVPADSAIVLALLKCSQDGKVLTDELYIEKTKRARADFKLDSLGRLKSTFIVQTDTVYITTVDTLIQEKKTEIQVVEVEKKLTKWQKIKQEAGGLGIGIGSAALLYGIFLVIKRFK